MNVHGSVGELSWECHEWIGIGMKRLLEELE